MLCNRQSASTHVISFWSSWYHEEVGRTADGFFHSQIKTEDTWDTERCHPTARQPGSAGAHALASFQCGSLSTNQPALPGNQLRFHTELSHFPLKSSKICSDTEMIVSSSFINRKRESSTLRFPSDLLKRPLVLQVIFYFWPGGVIEDLCLMELLIFSQLKLLLLFSGIFQVHIQKLLSCPATGLLVSVGECIMLK